jgi:hypothetical protein|nr:MAG TPA: hypothetical protein [Caudoviricetes sp.]
MVIRLDENYNAMTSTALLGYVGETNARPVSVEGLTVDGADRYVLTIDYGDGVQYEVDITGGTWTPTADILRSAQTVSCQICAKKLSGDEYILVKKSRIFRLRIGAAIGDTAIPSPSVAADALDRIDAIGRQAHADMQKAKSAADTATTAAENAEKSATTAGVSADTATQAASRAETAKTSAETSATQADTAKQGAETAAQTAQSVADSLPDDYTTAVEKIAENTVEISAVKLTDKELQRRVNALYDMGNGVTHQFETYSDTAYQKAVPTGAKLMSVKNIGGRSIVWNQLVQSKSNEITGSGVKITFSNDGIVTLNGTCTTTGNAASVQPVKNQKEHKYLIVANPLSGVYGAGQLLFSSQSYGLDSTGHGAIITNGSSNEKWYYTLYVYKDVTYDNVKLQPQIFDLTQMFGAGNEPSTVEEFEAMFPNDYYPYNAGEIVSAGTEEVAVGDTAYPIPEAIRNLPGYGWSAGTARNYVDYENKRYVQCVSSVDLGTLDWKFNTTSSVGNHFYALADHLNFKYLGEFGSTIYNALCSKYRTVARNSHVFVDKTLAIDGVTVVSQIQVKDTAYPDVTAFKQAMQGVILYYELATPIVTDISTMIPDDFLRNIEVEAGGSVTFKTNNDNYHIPVPSEEEYVVKLSEIGGTT